MKKQLRAILSLILCAACLFSLLAGCGGNDELGNVTYGRYVEDDISPEGMSGYPQSFVAFPDGTLDLISVDWGSEENGYQSSYLRWRSADGGKTWQSLDMSWIDEYNVDYSDYYDRGETPEEQISIGTLAPFENGDLMMQLYRNLFVPDEEIMGGKGSYNQITELYRVSQDGTVTPYSIPEYEQAAAESDYVYLNQFQALPGNRFFMVYEVQPTEEEMSDPNFDWNSTSRRGVYDMATGEKLYDLNFNGWNIYYNSTTLFLYDWNEGLSAVNISDGSPSTAPLPNEALLQQAMNNYSGGMFVDDDNTFYTVSARGMEKIAVDSEEPEKVMDGLNYTYGSPLYSINSMVYNNEDDSLVIAAYQYSENTVSGKLLRYYWDDEAIASSDNKIRVYSLYDNYSVRLALSEYKRTHPEVTIEYETAFTEDTSGGGITPLPAAASEGGSGTGDTGMTEEDALRALNTELLNGTGPDVLILDGLPVESFIEKGVLEDLSSIVNGNDDLLRPLFDPMFTGDKIYAVPTNFYVPTLFGEKGYVEQFSSIDALVSAIQQGPDKPAYQEYDPNWTAEEEAAYYQSMYGAQPSDQQVVLNFTSMDDLFQSFYTTCAPSIFSEKNGINQANLTTFLNAVKDVSDKYLLSDPDNMGYGGASMSMSMGGYATWSISDSLYSYGERRSRLGFGNLGSFNVMQQISYSLYYSQNQEQWWNQPATMYDEDGNPISEGEPQDEAEDTTVKLPAANPNIISAPGIESGVYVPLQIAGVTSTSNQKELAMDFIKVMLSEEVQKHDMGNGFPVTRSAFESQDTTYSTRDQYMVQEGISMIPFDFETLVGTLSVPMYQNSYLQGVIKNHTQSYCTGSTSLEEAVSQIVKETELYFAERQ